MSDGDMWMAWRSADPMVPERCYNMTLGPDRLER